MISLFDLAEASSVCCMIDLASIPLFSSDSLQQERCRELAWYGGGDYGLLFTIPPSHIEKIKGIDKGEIFLIGEVCEGKGVVSYEGSPILIHGYSHF